MITTAAYLGPAVVTSIDGSGERVTVELPGGDRRRARLAIPPPYRAVAGDELLVAVHESDGVWAIGVLRATGPTRIVAPGDLEIEAPRGTIRITAAAVKVTGGVVEIIAGRLLQRARAVYAWVSGVFQLRSRRIREVCEGDWVVKAGGKASVRATGDVRVDGKTVNLG